MQGPGDRYASIMTTLTNPIWPPVATEPFHLEGMALFNTYREMVGRLISAIPAIMQPIPIPNVMRTSRFTNVREASVLIEGMKVDVQATPFGSGNPIRRSLRLKVGNDIVMVWSTKAKTCSDLRQELRYLEKEGKFQPESKPMKLNI